MTKPNDSIEKFNYLDARLNVDFDTGILTFKANELNNKDRHNTQAGTPNDWGYLRCSATVFGKHFHVKAHRFVWWKKHGMPVPDVINHINNVKDDNRLCNLEPDDSASNARKHQKPNRWFYTGIFRSSVNSWGYKISIKGKRIHKYGFTNPLAAATAYIRRLHLWELTGE